MTYVRKKVAKNTTSTFNTKTGQTRYTTSNKVGNITNSTSHKGSSTRATKTTNVGGAISRTSSSYSPPKMKPYKTPKTRKQKYPFGSFIPTKSGPNITTLLVAFVVGIIFMSIVAIMKVIS